MSNKSGILGSFEELVLLAVAHGDGEAYGMTVRREIESRIGRSVNIGAVYATLDRMEAKHLVTSVDRRREDERKGRAKRYFRIQPEGARALLEARSAHEAMWAELDVAAIARQGGVTPEGQTVPGGRAAPPARTGPPGRTA